MAGGLSISSLMSRGSILGATERNEELSLPAGNSREIPWQSPCTRKGVSNEIDSNDSREGPSRLPCRRRKSLCLRLSSWGMVGGAVVVCQMELMKVSVGLDELWFR